jgi:hypothetical protein
MRSDRQPSQPTATVFAYFAPSAVATDRCAHRDLLRAFSGLEFVESERGREVAVGVDLRLEIGHFLLGRADRVGAGDEPERRLLLIGVVSNAWASLAGSPCCWPFCASHHSRWAALPSA